MKLYKGTFNWHCELHVLYSHAKSESKAFDNFVVQLAKLLNVNKKNVYLYFVDKSGYKYKVKEVK